MYKIIILTALLIGLSHTLSGQCNINVSKIDLCASETIQVSVDSPDQNTIYSWDFNEDQVDDFTGVDTTLTISPTFSDTSLTITLYENGDSCSSTRLSINPLPDISIGVPAGIVFLNDNELRACNGSPQVELSIFNRSQTFNDNKTYTINWGDGSPAETHDNSSFSQSSTISHIFSRLGYFSIFITAEGLSGCTYTERFTFYNGGNPSVGLVNPGNTVGLCAPATLSFPITNTENNPPGTEYQILVSGVVVDTFSQGNVPPDFTYTFDVNSCSAVTTTGAYTNAFDVQIRASNPCNSSAATVEPIEVSSPPDLDFGISSPATFCAGETIQFDNQTTNVFEIISGNPSDCIDVLNPNWTISGNSGEDWNVVEGSLFGNQNVAIEFLNPGVYTITMTVVSFACGEFNIDKTVTIFDPPQVTIQDTIIDINAISDGSTCTPFETIMPQVATGDSLSYNWTITPEVGWVFSDSTDQRAERPHIQFLEGGDYMIRVEVSNPCSSIFWEASLSVPGPPDVALQPIPDFCQSTTLDFNANNVLYIENGSPITTTNWSFPGANTSNSSEAYPTGIAYDSVGSYVVLLTMENACGIRTVSDTFFIQQPGTLNLPSDTSICSSEPRINLQATPLGGTWSGPGVRGNYFYPDEAFNGRNSVTYTYGTGVCFSQGTFEVTVHPAPNVDAGPDQTVCQNGSPIRLNGQPNNGNWINTDLDLMVNNDLINPNINPAGNYPIIYELTDNQGCSGLDTMILTILTVPSISVLDTTYCFTPGRVRLPIASPAGGNWSGQGIVAPAGFFNPITAGGPGTYNLTYSLGTQDGCTATQSIQVGIIDPSDVDAGNDLTICASDSIIQLNQIAQPGGGRWTSNSPGLVKNTFDPWLADAGANLLIYRVGTGNCRVTDTLIITVIRLTNANAGPNENICENELEFQLNGGQPTGGRWTGPGITDPINGSFDPQLLAPGSYEINYLIEDNVTGCNNVDTKVVNIRPLPIASFEVPPSICTQSTLEIQNNSTEAQTVNWSLNDGRNFNENNPSILFNQEGTFQIDLFIESNFGCRDSFSQTLEVIEAPKAQFTVNEMEGCGLLSPIFINQSSGLNNQYQWDFGNGTISPSTTPDIQVEYLAGINDTTYTVTLEAKNQCGLDIQELSLIVRSLPKVNFGFTVDTACTRSVVSFSNISQGLPTSFLWDFGNGNRSSDSIPAPQPFMTDAVPLEIPITLIGTNECGSDTLIRTLYIEPETVTSFFNTSKLKGCPPLSIEFEDFSTPGTRISWDFGDGSQSNLQNITHVYTDPGNYQVKQYTSNSCAMDSSTISIEVLPQPSANFTTSENLCQGQSIQFDNLSQNFTNATWFFGTGDTTNVLNPSYSYLDQGEFNVVLRITDIESGCTNEKSQIVSIGVPPIPIASLSASSGCIPLTVNFSNLSQEADFYQWDFGDENSSVERDPTHTFETSGNFSVRLKATSLIGCTIDTLLDIVNAFPLPHAEFTVEDSIFCGLPSTVQLVNQSDEASGYLWDFGDQLTSSFRNPAHEFTQSGNYNIQLTARNEFGCEDTWFEAIELIDQPIADFILDSLEGCSPLTISLQNFGNGTSYLWDFGDGTSSTDPLPQHTYQTPGRFDISLMIGNQNQCYDTLEIPSLVEVWPSPIANFSWSEEIIGQPTGRVLFKNESQGAEQFVWEFGDGNSSTAPNPAHRYRANSIWETKLSAFADNGCVDDTLIIIEPRYFGKLYVPNAFAPGSGFGDSKLFLPKGHGLKEYHLQIFSAYGELLWETFDIQEGQPITGWDGTQNGLPLPQDVYVWKIRAVFENGLEWQGNQEISGKFQKMGSVTLIR